ncbi:FG-GAP repeat domain-containing protein [Streptomyces gardneri]|uniref:FG-GAP repeat domain-containing protein n=1 Tax=Streptomyces gardneri TaxID=66892 RepID=UPI0037D71B71
MTDQVPVGERPCNRERPSEVLWSGRTDASVIDFGRNPLEEPQPCRPTPRRSRHGRSRGDDGTFAPRTRVGGGWGAYDRIVNIGDVDRDGRADLIAESGTEDYAFLTVYKGTGNWKAPFRAGAALNTAAPYAYGVRPAIF